MHIYLLSFNRAIGCFIQAIENPDQPDADIGRNSFMLPKIKRAFEHAHQLLSAALFGQTEAESYLSFVIRTDDPVLATRCGELFLERGSFKFYKCRFPHILKLCFTGNDCFIKAFESNDDLMRSDN